LSAVRILIDYRPALRERTGVGEYVHQLARALSHQRVDRAAERRAGDRRATVNADQIELFTSSWRDRPTPQAVQELAPASVVDRRIPVRLLNRLWHRFEAPAVEWLTGKRYDVLHSPHPLLLPTRGAARLVTVHDLDFLHHPERGRAEIRRDYARLARDHARRADGVIVPSAHVGRQVESELGLSPERITVCPHGVPDWRHPDRAEAGSPAGRHLLFMGTLEPRKNVAGLLEAYRLLLGRRREVPPLVVAGGRTEASTPWIEAMTAQPFAGHVDYRGYVGDAGREELFLGARLLVLPSFDEGFGLPVLEAMSLGVPVVAADRGALPEVAGDAALLVDPEEPESIALAMEQVLDDSRLARRLGERGLRRAAAFTWARSAELTRAAYERAIDNRGKAGA
jgi:glycosyltransferase involved in cell wall biosynthesis